MEPTEECGDDSVEARTAREARSRTVSDHALAFATEDQYCPGDSAKGAGQRHGQGDVSLYVDAGGSGGFGGIPNGPEAKAGGCAPEDQVGGNCRAYRDGYSYVEPRSVYQGGQDGVV